MIDAVYDGINEAFRLKDYNKVIDLMDKALQIPNLGFDQGILYKYGYSLLKMKRIKEGINVLRSITVLTKNSTIEQNIINNYEKLQKMKLPLKEYLENGYELSPGLVVNINHSAYLIWKVWGDSINTFKVNKYNKHGVKVLGFKYFKAYDMAFNTNLEEFNIRDIKNIMLRLDTFDYNMVIKDLYERNCIFGNIQKKDKNIFVEELEKDLNISKGDIINVFDPLTRHNRFYYVIDIDEGLGIYRTIAITHEQGQLKLKNKEIIDIPFDTFISGKSIVSIDYKKQLASEVASLENSILTKKKLSRN